MRTSERDLTISMTRPFRRLFARFSRSDANLYVIVVIVATY